MKVLLSWLRDYVDVKASAEEIAALMSVRGFAVEGIERLPAIASAEADAILDFEVTGNRPDCMSVVGIAREVATAYDLALLEPGTRALGPGGWGLGARVSRTTPVPSPQPPVPSTQPPVPGEISISIDAPDLCTRYVGALADVTIGRSPEWMQQRLIAGGVRPISNIVDITNYVMLELGQPMHAFDHAKIGERTIRVRRAHDKEQLRTLDNTDRTLETDMLVIADAYEPIAVGGVKGGALSEITSATRTIVFEAAHFNPLSVRRTSRKLGLKTDASMRFERGTDPNLPLVAMQRAVELLHQSGAGASRGQIIDCHPVTVEPSLLVLREAKLRGLLGTTLDEAEVMRILTRLGFGVGLEPDGPPRAESRGWEVTVPTRRVDVQREVDLIEEVARHVGLDRIPTTYPAPVESPSPSDPRIARARQLRAVMTGIGFSEAMTFGFISEAEAMPFAAEGDLAWIANPLSENFAVLRPSALPGLVAAIAHNRHREQRDVRLFEIGNRFSVSGGERWSLAAAWTGAAGGDHWSGGRRDVDFFDIKGVVSRVALAFGIDLRTEVCTQTWLTPGQAAALVAAVSGPLVATFGRLLPAIAEQHGLPAADAIYVLEFDLDAASTLSGSDAGVRVSALPRFPSVTRDIAILVVDTLPAQTIRETVRTAAPPTLVSVREFDRYQGKGVPDGQVSLALRLTFRSPDRTLTDAEINAAMDAVLSALRTKHSAVQR